MLLAATTATAGSGPWVVGDGRASVYLGVEAERLTKLATTIGEDREVIDVGEGIAKFGVRGIATVGLGRRLELEASVPWYRVQANRPDAELCGALGLGACETTQGVGVVEARGKGVVLDEYFGAPFSLALGAQLRIGDLTASTRERVTNLGEGSLDAGPFLSIGRTGALGGGGYWSSFLEGGFRYRSPVTDSYPGNGGDGVPGSEIYGSAQVLFAPDTRFAIGPSAYLLDRPFGLDFGELDLTDPDRFGALRVLQASAGLTTVLRARQDVAVALSALRTVAAANNPTDVWVVSLGVQVDGNLPGGGDG
jgi:hypothetical protein